MATRKKSLVTVTSGARRLIEKRRNEVGKLRDKLRGDIDDLTDLYESLDETENLLGDALANLERAADEMSKYA